MQGKMEINGVELNYRIDGPEGAPGVVMSNSWATDYTMWDVNMEALRSATTDADGISPLPSPRYTMSQPTESFQSHQVDDGGHGSITLALKHSQSSRLPGRKTPPPANRFNDRLNRTTSLEGRFRTKSARTLQRRPTVETKVAIVSKDLAPDASSSDDDSSGEDTPKRQQRFVNQ